MIRWRGDTRADAVHGPPLLGHGVVDSRTARSRGTVHRNVGVGAPDHAGHAPRPAATPASPGAWRVRSRWSRGRHAPSPPEAVEEFGTRGRRPVERHRRAHGSTDPREATMASNTPRGPPTHRPGVDLRVDQAHVTLERRRARTSLRRIPAHESINRFGDLADAALAPPRSTAARLVVTRRQSPFPKALTSYIYVRYNSSIMWRGATRGTRRVRW